LNQNNKIAIIVIPRNKIITQPCANLQILLDKIDQLRHTETDSNWDVSNFIAKVHDQCSRVIIIYCQTFLVPDFPNDFKPPFSFDSIYVHDKQSLDNFVQVIYDTLSNVGSCFELEKSTIRLSYAFTILLGNPVIRSNGDFKIIV
jgi:hypothetical protein